MTLWLRARTDGVAYLIALVGVLCAAIVRYQLEPILAGSIPVVIFTLPVVVSALKGGFWPGLFCTVVGALLSAYLFIPPLHSFAVNTQGTVILLTFFAVGVTISIFGQRMKNLQARLIGQATELAATNGKLQQASSRKDEFLAMLAHELRNPLAGISTAAELLKLIPTDDERIGRAGGAIYRQVLHMTKLVDDLLDVSRVTRGLVAIDTQPLALCDVVHSAVEQVRTALAAKQQHLTLDLPHEPCAVSGDRTRLTQVISNLLANANRYSPAGSAIRIQVRTTQAEVIVRVEDDGQGIEADLQPHIFDLFVQAERGIDRSQGGLGIGLALVKRITELHQGSVQVHSAGSGMGSCFTVTLPRVHGSVQAGTAQGAQGQTASAGEPMQILIVDDNRDAADSTASLLQAHGHVVTVEYDANAALAHARAQRLDVVILDIGMPDKDGRELCRTMKQFPHLSHTTFIALSGYGQARDVVLSQQAGFDRHFTKPVRIESLLEAMPASVCEASALARRLG